MHLSMKDSYQLFHKAGNEMVAFALMDQTGSDTTYYYGYESDFGSWIIQEQVTSGNTSVYRYAAGRKGYEAAWAARAAKTYGLYSALFDT